MLRRKLLAVYLILMAAAVGLAAYRPVAFQKSNAVVSVEAFEALGDADRAFDAETVLRTIPPPRPNASNVWAVQPAEKSRQTLVEGRGNCSHLAFGLAYQLDREGVDYQVVHFMPPGGFLSGEGHTVLRTRFTHQGRTRVGLVDVVGGGLPMRFGRVLDVSDLMLPISNLEFAALNPGRRPVESYYIDLARESVVGTIPGRDINAYHAFLESVYVPLGNPKLEKYVFDGLALWLGRYPQIRVMHESRLFAGHEVERAAHRGALWVLRSPLVVFPVWVFGECLLPLLAAIRSAVRAAATGRVEPLPVAGRSHSVPPVA